MGTWKKKANSDLISVLSNCRQPFSYFPFHLSAEWQFVHADRLNLRGDVCMEKKARMRAADNEGQEKRRDWKITGRMWAEKRELGVRDSESRSTIITNINPILLFFLSVVFSSFCSPVVPSALRLRRRSLPGGPTSWRGAGHLLHLACPDIFTRYRSRWNYSHTHRNMWFEIYHPETDIICHVVVSAEES